MYYLIENKTSRVLASNLPRIDAIPVQGFRVFTVEDNVPIDEEINPPLNAMELAQQNYEGLLAFNPQYAYTTYDDLSSETSWNISALNTRGAVGDGNTWLASTTGLLQTQSVIAGTAFDRGKMFWSVYEMSITDSGPLQRNLHFNPLMPDAIQVSISNDGGTSFVATPYGVEFILGGLGNQIVVRFENPNVGRVYLGHFGLVY